VRTSSTIAPDGSTVSTAPPRRGGSHGHDHGPDKGHGQDNGDGGAPQDTIVLLRALEASDQFRRDSALGGIFHHGKISFREVSLTDSLHVIIDGNKVSAHVDAHSPLRIAPDGSARYAWSRVVIHNAYGFAGEVARRITGRHGEQRCNLTCEVEWVDDEVADVLGDDGRSPTGEVLAERAGAGARRVPERVEFGLVDQAVHLLDSEAAPWSIQLEADVDGRLDEETLRAALRQAMATHPMARATKMASRGSQSLDNWHIPAAPDLDPLTVVECADDEAVAAVRAELQGRMVPLVESPPLRARLVRGPAADTLMLNVNHAAMDCFGGLRVLQSVARGYAGEPDPPPELDLVESRELPVRLWADDTAGDDEGDGGRPGAGTAVTGTAASGKTATGKAWAAKVRDLVVPPARLATDGATDEVGYGFHHVALDREATAALFALQEPGSELGVLLAALHLAIEGWNLDHGRRCRRIGVLVPANLRPPRWRDEMVGNFCLPARAATTRRDRRTPQAALEALAHRGTGSQRPGMGAAVVDTLARSRFFPLWVKRALAMTLPVTGNRLVDTAALCYLGQLPAGLSFGPAAGAATGLWFSPPARMPLGLAVGAVTVSGRLHLVFRHRHRMFDTDACRRFAGRYLAELDRLTEGCSPVG